MSGHISEIKSKIKDECAGLRNVPELFFEARLREARHDLFKQVFSMD